jgi:AraC-like DNA-binding protein
MEIIFIIGASQALFLAFLAFNKKNRSNADFVLAIWLFLIAINLIDFYLLKTGLAYEHPHLLGIGACIPLIHGPFMYVYLLVMISRNSKILPGYLLHGIPFIAFTIYFMFDFYFLNGAEKIAYIEKQANDPYPVIILLNVLILAAGPLYIMLSLLRLRTHMNNIANNFSYTEGVNLRWLRYVISGLTFIWLMVVLSNILSKVPVITDSLSENIIYMSVTIAVFFLGYYGIKQKAIYIDSPKSVKAIKKLATGKRPGQIQKVDDLSQKEDKEVVYMTTLLDFFDTEKPYLNNKLSLKEVADALNIPLNLLSSVINRQTGKSFFNFVNSYRVTEFMSRLADPANKNYTLMAIAYESGFNSKSSFNRIFKDYTGLTPSEFNASGSKSI